MRRGVGPWVCSTVALLAIGCVSRTHVLYRGPVEPRSAGVRLASLGHPPGDRFGIRVESLAEGDSRPLPGSGGTHRRLRIVMPSAGANGQADDLVRATFHQSLSPGRKRLVVVLPIWGASTYPPRQVVRRLIGRGDAVSTDVLEVHGESTLFDWASLGAAESEAEFLRRLEATTASIGHSVADVRRLLDWAERRADVDPGRIGIVGLSIGAIVGSLVMGQDDRLAAGVLVMGGANLHQVFGSCRGRSGEVRRRLGRRFGWDAETFSRKIEATLERHNPKRFAGNVHPSRVLMIDAAFDHCMPQSARDELWEAMGRPERITLTYGHHVAFFSMTPLGLNYTTRRIVDFLDRRLQAEETSPPRPGVSGLGAGR